MNPVIRAGKSSTQEILTRERCYIRERLNDPRVPEVSIAECRVLPGVTTELHRLAVDEWYLINEGQGLVEVGDAAAVPVGPGDTVIIPQGTAQRIRNTGTGDLRFLCICKPRFTTECYEGLEA